LAKCRNHTRLREPHVVLLMQFSCVFVVCLFFLLQCHYFSF